jgi:hypothetical protein
MGTDKTGNGADYIDSGEKNILPLAVFGFILNF